MVNKITSNDGSQEAKIFDALNYADKLEGSVKKYRRYMLLALLITILAISALGLFSYHSNETNKIMQENMKASYDIQRSDLIAGLYSTNKAVVHGVMTYSERMEAFVKKAKAIILEFNPDTNLNEQEINDFLITNFKYSEQYMIDPWICFTFARVESWFNNRGVVSKAGALGLLQIMPETMAAIMGDDYYRGCEYNIKLAVKTWYRIVLPLIEIFDGDLKWIAICYLGGSYYPRKAISAGNDFESFMQDFKIRNPDCWTYPYDIEKLYYKFKE